MEQSVRSLSPACGGMPTELGGVINSSLLELGCVIKGCVVERRVTVFLWVDRLLFEKRKVNDNLLARDHADLVSGCLVETLKFCFQLVNAHFYGPKVVEAFAGSNGRCTY